MSKIQKAIRALRESQSRKPTKEDRAEAFIAKHGPNTGVQADEANPVTVRSNGQSVSALKYPQGFVELPIEHYVELKVDNLLRGGVQAGDHQYDAIAEQFRRAKRPILKCAFGDEFSETENANVVMIASAMPGAGKTFCSFNLAQSIALERDFGAVLVDADVLNSNLTSRLSMENRPGLIDYLLDKEMHLDDILVRTDLHEIVVVPAGKSHPEATELLSSRRMRELVSDLAIRFKYRAVIFDTPPILVTNEAHALAQNMGQIVIVIDAGKTSQESVTHALGSFDRSKPINIILNKSRAAAVSGYHSDDYGYYPYFGESREIDHERR